MNRPWMKFHTRDWLDNKELRRCSPAARGVLADLMSLAHEGEPYGYLTDKMGALTIEYMASRSFIKIPVFIKLLGELAMHHRITQDPNGSYFIPRLIEDEAIRLSRSEDGRKGGNPYLVKFQDKQEVNQLLNGEDKHARAGADSVSVSLSVLDFPKKEVRKTSNAPMSNRFDEYFLRQPGKTLRRDLAAGVWAHEVTTDNETAVFACLERYMASAEVARGAVMNPENWLSECAAGNFTATWPGPPIKARDSPVPRETLIEKAKREWREKHGAEGDSACR